MPWVGSPPAVEITFDSVVDELRARHPELTQARAVMFVSWCLARMVGDSDYRRKVTTFGTTVTDQSVYDVPTDAIDIRRIWIEDGKYARVNYDDILDLDADRVSIIDPSLAGVFAPYDSSDGDPQIAIWPAPDEDGLDITLEGSYEGTDVTYGSGAITIIPSHLTTYLLDGAIAEALRASSRHDLAPEHEARFETGTEKLRRHKNSRIGSGPARIRLTR